MELATPQKNYVAKELPKGVYARGTKKPSYQGVFWARKGRLVAVGTFTTPEEAEYKRKVAEYGHHWDNLDPEISKDAFGFIYKMTNKATGKMYIGKKQFYHWNGPVGGFKATNPTDEWWDSKAWKGSEWETYMSSSVEVLSAAVKGNPWDFTYEVIDYGTDKLDLHIAEVNHQMEEDVLERLDKDGEFLYYNKNVAGMLFRPPFKKAELSKVKETTVEAMRNYYLKPLICLSCGSVIPYGDTKCSCGYNTGDPFGA